MDSLQFSLIITTTSHDRILFSLHKQCPKMGSLSSILPPNLFCGKGKHLLFLAKYDSLQVATCVHFCLAVVSTNVLFQRWWKLATYTKHKVPARSMKKEKTKKKKIPQT